MSRCRTCGKVIYCINAKNLFQQPEGNMLNQIEAISGLRLVDQIEFPSHICGPCEVAVREAIVFRERTIKTQMLLLNSNSVADALQKIDFEEKENLSLKNDGQAGISSTYEEMPNSDCMEDKIECGTLDHQNKVVKEINVMDQSTVRTRKEKPAEPRKVATSQTPEALTTGKQGKPTENLYGSVKFGNIAKKKTRINWGRLTKEEFEAKMRESRKRDCVCEHCGRHFTCASNFRIHLLKHIGVKNFSCKQCPMKFYTAHLLRRHNFKHDIVKPYPCRYCDKTYACLSGRNQHEQHNHTHDYPFKCTICDKGCVSRTKLKMHMVSHSDIRKFHCDICNLSFKVRKHLDIHNRSKSHVRKVQSESAVSNSLDTNLENVFL